MYKITVISDTHNKHNQLELPGGDILIHSDDLSSRGYKHEVDNFCNWFDKQSLKYNTCIFIAGNHDFGFENNQSETLEIVNSYKNINYLQDEEILFNNIGDLDKMIKIYGTPWQPFFHNWAFNLPKNGPELEYVWNKIPNDTDILITHGPPLGILDKSGYPYNESNLGCEKLLNRINIIKPKIHIFGHIHGSYGYLYKDGTHFINASVLDEDYIQKNTPLTFNWDEINNTIEFI